MGTRKGKAKVTSPGLSAEIIGDNVGSGFCHLLGGAQEGLWVLPPSLCAAQGSARPATSAKEEPPMPPPGGHLGPLSAGSAPRGTTVPRELLSQCPAQLGPSTTPLVSVTSPMGLSCGDSSGDQLPLGSLATCYQRC